MKKEEIQCNKNEMLTGYVNCEDHDTFQFIYGGLNHGTFYCVFCKLGIENDYLKKITFQLYNYKGRFNIKNKQEEDDELNPDKEKKPQFKFISMKASFSKKYDMAISLSDCKTILRINMPVTWKIRKDYCEEYSFASDPLHIKDLERIHVNREFISIFKPKLTDDDLEIIFTKMASEVNTMALNRNCERSKMKVVPPPKDR